MAKLIQGVDGNYYGVAQLGGTNSSGTAFQIASNNYAFTLLTTFKFTNGYQPNFIMQGSDGNLYGTTTYGGTNIGIDSSGTGFGTIFQLSTNGAFTSLFSFAGTNGTSPNSLVQASNGTFYGTVKGGNPAENPLNSFAITGGGLFTFGTNHQPTNLFFFSTNNGSYPNSPLVLGTNGIYYGVTLGGGANSVGTAYDLTPGGVFASVAPFTDATGYSPNVLIKATDGNFYGTDEGGASAAGTQYGTVFRLKTDGTLTTVAKFSPATGFTPNCLIQGNDGNFYGTASQGGLYTNGSVFMLSTNNNTITSLYAFTGGVDGSNPTSILQGKDGNFYGATAYGGTTGQGNIFRLSIVPTPTFQSITKSNTTVSLSWAAAAGHNYQVQYSTNLLLTNWTVLKTVATTNSIGTTTDINPADTKRFYRILLLN